MEINENLVSTDALAARSVAAEDFDEASDALLELERRDKRRAAEVSLRILDERIGDVFYRAFAFEVLYSSALDDAIEFVESQAGTAEVYVLGAMIEAVTEDSGAITHKDEIRKAAALLKKVLGDRSTDEVSSISDKIDRFVEAYP